MTWWLWTVAWASGDGLAPTLGDVDAAMARVDALLLHGQQATGELSDVQNRWVQDGCVQWRCDVKEGVVLVWRSRAAGHAARDHVQAARAELRRAERAAAFAGVAPLMDSVRQARLSDLAISVDRAMAAWSARAAWQQTYVEPWAWSYRARVAAGCPEGDAP